MTKNLQDKRIVNVQAKRIDNFVVVFVTYATGLRGVGVAHCDKTDQDKFSIRRGVKLALRRAQPIPPAKASKLGLTVYAPPDYDSVLHGLGIPL